LTIPCILAIHENSLIRFTIETLTSASEGDLIVIESKAETIEKLIQEINQYKAKVILFENTYPLVDENSFAKLLTLYPNLLVVIIQKDNNWLQIFRKEKKLLTSATDLLDIIRSA
jgi:hypothetical protein